MHKHPYYLARKRAEAINVSTRGLPLGGSKPEFHGKVNGVKYFSVPEFHKGEQLTAVEKEKQIVADRRKEYDEFMSKLKVDKIYMKVNTIVKDRPSQLDKVNGLR